MKPHCTINVLFHGQYIPILTFNTHGFEVSWCTSLYNCFFMVLHSDARQTKIWMSVCFIMEQWESHFIRSMLRKGLMKNGYFMLITVLIMCINSCKLCVCTDQAFHINMYEYGIAVSTVPHSSLGWQQPFGRWSSSCDLRYRNIFGWVHWSWRSGNRASGQKYNNVGDYNSLKSLVIL